MTQRQVAIPAVPVPGKVAQYSRNTLQFVKKQPLGVAGLFMVLLVIVFAVFAAVIGRYDPTSDNYLDRLQGPSASHFFGTDDFGRDQWSRIVYGARISLQVGFISVAIGSSMGLILGVITGYLGGAIDTLTQRVVEMMLSIPGLLLALALVASLGSGVDKVIIALSILGIPSTLRVMRGTVLSVKQNVYIDAAQVIGASPTRVIFRHVLPNVTAPFLIIASSHLGGVILTEATLSFLGLGVPPPHASWGRMLAGSAASYAMTAPWMVIFPGLAITWIVLGSNLFGDALRDIWDPRLRGR